MKQGKEHYNDDVEDWELGQVPDVIVKNRKTNDKIFEEYPTQPFLGSNPC